MSSDPAAESVSDISYTVIVPAAGYGSRMLPASKAIPKEMITIVNKPAIECIVAEIVTSGLTTIVFITSPNKESLINHFDRNYELEQILSTKGKTTLLDSITKYKGLDFTNIRQREALGLGHAVFMAKTAIAHNPFVVVLPDMIIKDGAEYMKKMLELHKTTGKGVIALMEVPYTDVSSYGVVCIDQSRSTDDVLFINNMIEKPVVDEAPSNLAIVGRYVLPNSVVEKLSRGKPDASGEIQLTNALKELAIEEGMLGVIVKNEIHDIGNPLGFIEANISYGLSSPAYRDKLIAYIKKQNLD
jgi:UTP--glucose-1-phosphate uridylyltransferase